jgi:hypothetical protein
MEKGRKEITLEDLKRVDAFLAMQPKKAPHIAIDLSKYIPRDIVDKDAELANNLRERQKFSGLYEYHMEWLREVAHECYLGLTDVEQVLNALIIVSEREKPQQP